MPITFSCVGVLYSITVVKPQFLFEKRGFKSLYKVMTRDVYAFLNSKQNCAISTKECFKGCF